MTGSLKSRLLAWMIGGMALLLAVFAAVVYTVIERSLNEGFNDSLSAMAQALAASVKQEPKKIEVEFDDREMPEFRRPDRPAYYQLWRSNGAVLKRSASLAGENLAQPAGAAGSTEFQDLALPDGRAGRAAILRFLPRVEDEQEDESVAMPPVTPESVTLVVARETAGLDADLATLRWLLAAAAGGTILLALAVGAVVVRQGMRPLDALAARIAAIREDNLSAVISLEGMPTEMAPVGRRLNGLLRRLEGAFRRERAFTADAAHELRTPLAGMRTTIEVALSRSRTGEAYRQSLRDSLDIVLRMQSMVDNLLMLARLESGQMTMQSETVKPAETVAACWAPLAPVALRRGIVFESRVPPDLQCAADRDHLALVVTNLLANAAEYTNDGGCIEVAGRPAAGGVEMTFSNTGCRLTAEEAPHVFERFWRGDAARTATGVHCGLGLALVRRLIAALGGSVSAEVNGDMFTVRLVLRTE